MRPVKDDFEELTELVLGPAVTCSCGKKLHHHYTVYNGNLLAVYIYNGGDVPILHRIMVYGQTVLSLGTSAAGGVTGWIAMTSADGIYVAPRGE